MWNFYIGGGGGEGGKIPVRAKGLVFFFAKRNQFCWSARILDPNFYLSLIQQQQQKSEKKIFTFFCGHQFHKIENYLGFEHKHRKLTKTELLYFLPQKLSLSSQKYGWVSGIPDPGLKKAPDQQHWKKQGFLLGSNCRLERRSEGFWWCRR